jgi:hypothetical protein
VQVIGQFYQLLRLGKSGYKAIMSNITATADFLSHAIDNMKDGQLFELMSATNGNGLPLVAWRLKVEQRFDEFAIAKGLRSRGWSVPACTSERPRHRPWIVGRLKSASIDTMAPKCDELKMLRIVIRSDFSRQRADTFLRDLSAVIDELHATPTAVLDHHAEQKKVSKHWGALQKAFACVGAWPRLSGVLSPHSVQRAHLAADADRAATAFAKAGNRRGRPHWSEGEPRGALKPARMLLRHADLRTGLLSLCTQHIDHTCIGLIGDTMKAMQRAYRRRARRGEKSVLLGVRCLCEVHVWSGGAGAGAARASAPRGRP